MTGSVGHTHCSWRMSSRLAKCTLLYGGRQPLLPTHAQLHACNLSVFAFYPMQNEVGKGAFQECDQLAAVNGQVKWAGQAATAADIPRTIAQAFQVGGWLRGLVVDELHCEDELLLGSRVPLQPKQVATA